jgi:hypothetical protein
VTDASGAKQRSVAFIEAAGDELARVRARALVGDQTIADVMERIPDVGTAPGIDRQLTILTIFDDLGSRDVPPVENACESLTRIQERDGSWRESAGATENERIFSTGMIAGYLAKTPFVRKSTLDSAAEHLASHWEADRLTGSIWRVTAAYLHCFSLVRHDQSDAILQWCGRELERGFHSDVYDIVQTARVFTLCKAHALPGSQLTRAELVERLIKEQNGDGSYFSRDDSSQHALVAHTLEALVALVRLT